LSRIKVAVASAVAPNFEQGTKIIPFVRPWSTTERIESRPRTGSARHGFVNPRGSPGMGEPGTGTG